MVCKEDVFMWFQSLRAHKRIEAVCAILNMCYPLELRFYGASIEDIGRKDYYVFKDDEVRANDVNEIVKVRNIHDDGMRSRLIVMLTLLNTTNTNCAREIYKTLTEEIKLDHLIASGLLLDPKVAEQYLVLLTLAQHHPAFTFEQQTFLCHLYINLENCIKEINTRTNSEIPEPYLPAYFPGLVFQPPNLSERDVLTSVHPYYNSSQQPHMYESPFEAQITSLRAKPPHRKMTVRIRVTWGCNKTTDAHKTPQDLAVFHRELVKFFPSEAQNINQDKCIPPMPVAIATWSKPNLNESIITTVAEYIQQLNSKLPGYILANEFVRKFFSPSNSNRATFRSGKHGEHKHSDLPPKSSRLRSLTIYNSQMSDSSPGSHPENRQKVSQINIRKHPSQGVYAQPSPIQSPLQSPLSSPYVSPGNSNVNSRAPSPWSSAAINETSVDKSQIREPVDAWEPIKSYKTEELHNMSIEKLESSRTIKDSGPNMSKAFDRKGPVNGMIGCYVPKGILPPKPISLNQSNSNDSSPICSEYSSPPQSPSPGETCNQSSSLSSSTDENIEKRSLSSALKDLCKIEDSESITTDNALKRTDDDSVNIKVANMNRPSLSVIPLAIPYSTIMTQLPPLQNIKPAYLPIPCRTNSVPQHINPIVFDNHNQFSRVPLASALTFIPGPTRSHPDRVMSPASLPISTMSPFPVVTSGCVTSPSSSCSISTLKSSNMTMVTNSALSSNRHMQKNINPIRDCDISQKSMLQTTETPYVTGYILNTSSPLTAATCPCFTTNAARPSPAPSPSMMSPGAIPPQPSAVPVSMSYLGMPYLFHHSIPFLQAQSPANGFVPQSGLTNRGPNFSYALPNVITTLPPELIYSEQTYTVQSASTQGNPSQIASPVSQCFGTYNQPTFVVATSNTQKLISCYNCGKVGHRGTDCKEPTMDDLSKYKFQLNFDPSKAPGSHE